MNNRQLATTIAQLDRYTGGYIYGGADASYVHKSKEQGWLLPQLQYRVHSARDGHDTSPDQARTAWNKRILTRLPIGSRVMVRWNNADYAGGEDWLKEGPCRWVLEDHWEEPND